MENLSKEQMELQKQGLPVDFLEKCEWCNGSGNDGGGYGACPDCDSTGYKYGDRAVDYIEEDMEKCHNLFQSILQILSDNHGFHQNRFIPRRIESFMFTYFEHLFTEEVYSDHSKMISEVNAEIPQGFFKAMPSIVGWCKKETNSICIMIDVDINGIPENWNSHQDCLQFKVDDVGLFADIFDAVKGNERIELTWGDLKLIPKEAEQVYYLY